MKLKLTIGLLLLLPIMLVQAQNSNSNSTKSYYGFKIGSDVTSDTHNYRQITEQFNGNLQVGAFARFGEKFFFQPEAYFHNYKLDSNESLSYFRAPLMLGMRLINLGIVTAHVNVGPAYSKQLGSDNEGGFSWQIGVGGDVLGFLTTDIRYTIPNGKDMNGAIEDLIAKGGMLNFTVGIKLK